MANRPRASGPATPRCAPRANLLQGAIDWITSNQTDGEAEDLNLDSAIRAEIELARAILAR